MATDNSGVNKLLAISESLKEVQPSWLMGFEELGKAGNMGEGEQKVEPVADGELDEEARRGKVLDRLIKMGLAGNTQALDLLEQTEQKKDLQTQMEENMEQDIYEEQQQQTSQLNLDDSKFE